MIESQSVCGCDLCATCTRASVSLSLCVYVYFLHTLLRAYNATFLNVKLRWKVIRFESEERETEREWAREREAHRWRKTINAFNSPLFYEWMRWVNRCGTIPFHFVWVLFCFGLTSFPLAFISIHSNQILILFIFCCEIVYRKISCLRVCRPLFRVEDLSNSNCIYS